MIAFALSVLLTATPVPKPGAPVRLPAHFTAGLISLRPVTVEGKRLDFLTDTGGALFIRASAVKRLGLPVQTMSGDDEQVKVVFLPELKPADWIPETGIWGGGLEVREVTPKAKAPRPLPEKYDGLLGMAWFEDRVWTLDYPGKKMLLRAEGDLPKVDASHVVPLHFPTEKDGTRDTSFARVQVKVAGEPLNLILDTGARARLSRTAMKAEGRGPAVRATNFIDQKIFDQWRQKHPDWKVVSKADLLENGASMIRVPKLEVAGYTVGPVWFTERSDDAFRKRMSLWTDQTVDGALGASALEPFRVTLDYPGAQALFEKPTR